MPCHLVLGCVLAVVFVIPCKPELVTTTCKLNSETPQRIWDGHKKKM